MIVKLIIAVVMSCVFYGSFAASTLVDEVIHYSGRYKSSKYHFLLSIPAGFVGLGAAPTAPNHGFRIDFSRNHPDEIRVNAEYDVSEPLNGQDTRPDYSSAPPGFEALQTRTKQINLSDLKALQVWQRLRRQSDGEIYICLDVAAERVAIEEKILYSIVLFTPERLYEQRLKVFRSIISSFRTLP